MKKNGKKIQRWGKLVGPCKSIVEILEQQFPSISAPISSASVLICIQQCTNVRSSLTLYSSMVADFFPTVTHQHFFPC